MRRAFTVPAILALALGIGATSATLSIVRGVMLEPLPYRDVDRVVSIWESLPSRSVRRNPVRPARLNVMLGNSPEEVEGLFASSDRSADRAARAGACRGCCRNAFDIEPAGVLST